MKQVLQIQAQLITYAPPLLDPNLVTVKLIGVCAIHSKLRQAALIFSQLAESNVFAWNAILKAYAQNHNWAYTLCYFNWQLSSPTGPAPNEYTFTSILKARVGLVAMLDGCKVHAVIIKTRFSSNIFIQNSLIDMYFKFGNLDIDQLLFDEILVRDVVSSNTLVVGYSLCGNVALVKRVFDKIPIKNLASWSAMIAGYCRSGDLEAARQLFDFMPERNVVSWNAMIAECAQNEKYSNAINLFHEMQKTGSVRPNNVTLISVLSACAHMGAFDLGKWIDHFISRSGMELSLFLGNALVDMYAKCGFIAEAKRIFDKMQERDVISWSIIISGLAMHGHAEEAFDYFFEMLECGIKPNEVTFMGLLSACTHAGLVDTGLKYFNMMDHKYGITPKIEHYGCVVDLLSRAGRLIEAEDLINSMPIEANVIVWGALLRGCCIYKDIERGERVVQHILELDSEHSGSYVYLANVYASVGRLDDAAKCRLNMRENRVMKTPGCSWIEVHNTVHEFFMGEVTSSG